MPMPNPINPQTPQETMQEPVYDSNHDAGLESEEAPSFRSEVRGVRVHLESAFADLDSALRHFVRKDLAAAEPFPLAVVILSAGLPVQDSPEVRQRRIFLAAALEMLRIALSIHDDLVISAAPGRAEKSLVGATILVGDYCFSHSASLAARTDSPFVVEVFSNALKVVSEGRLRALFDGEGGDAQIKQPYGDQEELCRAGAQAATHLADLSAQQSQALMDVAALVGRTLDQGESPVGLYGRIDERRVPVHQQPRWRQALAYLAAGAAEPSSGAGFAASIGGSAL